MKPQKNEPKIYELGEFDSLSKRLNALEIGDQLHCSFSLIRELTLYHALYDRKRKHGEQWSNIQRDETGYIVTKL